MDRGDRNQEQHRQASGALPVPVLDHVGNQRHPDKYQSQDHRAMQVRPRSKQYRETDQPLPVQATSKPAECDQKDGESQSGEQFRPRIDADDHGFGDPDGGNAEPDPVAASPEPADENERRQSHQKRERGDGDTVVGQGGDAIEHQLGQPGVIHPRDRVRPDVDGLMRDHLMLPNPRADCGMSPDIIVRLQRPPDHQHDICQEQCQFRVPQ